MHSNHQDLLPAATFDIALLLAVVAFGLLFDRMASF
jgi:hypothetical protein